MKKTIEVNGIQLSDALILELNQLQCDNGDLAKYHQVKLSEVIGIIANLNEGGKTHAPEELLAYVSLLTNISMLLNKIIV